MFAGLPLTAPAPRGRRSAALGPRWASIRKQAVVLGQPFGAGNRADLDLAGGGGDGEVGDGRVLGLARAGRDDRAIAVAAGQVEGVEASRRGSRPG